MTSERRVDPFLGTPVHVVTARQDRPNLPSDECPFCVGGEKPQTSIRSGHFLIVGLRSQRVDVRLFSTHQNTTRHFLLSAQKVPVRSLIFGLIEQRLFPHSTMLNLFSSSKIGVPKLAPRSLTHTARFTHLITYHRARPSIRSWLETRCSSDRSIHS